MRAAAVGALDITGEFTPYLKWLCTVIYVCMYVCMDESIYDEIMFLLSFIGVFESMYVCTPTILPMPARPKYMYVQYVCMYVCGNLSNVLWLSALLLNAGCDRTLKDNNGLTARDHASRHSFTVMIQFISQSMVRWPTARTTDLRLYDCIYLWMNEWMNVCMYVRMYFFKEYRRLHHSVYMYLCLYVLSM